MRYGRLPFNLNVIHGIDVERQLVQPGDEAERDRPDGPERPPVRSQVAADTLFLLLRPTPLRSRRHGVRRNGQRWCFFFSVSFQFKKVTIFNQVRRVWATLAGRCSIRSTASCTASLRGDRPIAAPSRASSPKSPPTPSGSAPTPSNDERPIQKPTQTRLASLI